MLEYLLVYAAIVAALVGTAAVPGVVSKLKGKAKAVMEGAIDRIGK